MKLLIVLSCFSLVIMSASECGKKNTAGTKYKARLEIKAICYNYTLSLLEGTLDTSQVVASWTDENTKVSYRNAFALANPCDFPPTLKQGDEFYFVIDTAKPKDCIVCMAYYPKPPKTLTIKVVDK